MISEPVSSNPLRIALIGAGNRSMLYASFALKQPDKMKIVAVAEPDPDRRAAAARLHAIPAEGQFDGFEAFCAAPKVADAVINGTMDQLHYDSTLRLLRAGYDILLEKPIAGAEWEVKGMMDCAKECGRTVMVCHVLRYAPFYRRIHELLAEGAIGKVISLHTMENVSYHHMATAFVRGRWNREETSNPMLLAKCCHDLDLVAWFMSGTRPVRVASFGSLMQFQEKNAPAGSTERCLNGCSVERNCLYSARRMYLESPLWGSYVWEGLRNRPGVTLNDAEKENSLRTDNPYGRCVWRCDNDVVDHQTVIVEFENGATATHQMLCATARAARKIHIVGETGEIEGDLEDAWILLRQSDISAQCGFRESRFELQGEEGGIAGHGGGDMLLVADFEKVLRGEPDADGSTRIENSLVGHQIVFRAEEARRLGRVVSFA